MMRRPEGDTAAMTEAADALHTSLRVICGELGLALTPEQTDALLDYLALLQRWNATYNLTAVREPAQMLTQHLADCLAVVAPLRRQLAGRPAQRLLDAGSGGGLPGIVLAVLEPALDVTCVDAVGKKAAFVRQVAVELRLGNLHSEHARVERLDASPFDVITSRAFSSLGDLTALTRRHLAPRGIWMAMKGKRPEEEIAALPDSVDVFHVEPLVIPSLGADRCIVWMRMRS
jgi:16S rRNA (guanine527-N7)-methyltransferase